MFKNMLAYKFEEPFILDVSALNEKLNQKPITPCLTQEMESLGWIELDDYSDAFAIQVNKAIFFRLCVERKLLPNSVVNTAIKARIKELNLKHVSRSDHKELHEYVVNKLLPKALVDRSYIYAYIDLETNHLVVNASSTKKASLLTSHLRKTLGSLPIVPLMPENSVAATLTHWALHGIESDVLSMLDEIELKELKDEGGNAKFKGVSL
ncbi:MAG: recombination-associated protein RdgC, partial [Wohlfahrtiimonas sp.]